jgi:hypothetical protein
VPVTKAAALSFKRSPEAEQLVDALRACLGMLPLYAKAPSPAARNARLYSHYERLRKRADPNCTWCDGAGYNCGAAHDGDSLCACLSAAPSTR